MRIGFTEILVVVIVILALIKPDKLKEYSTTLGKTFRALKEEKDKAEAKYVDPIKEDINSVKEDIDVIKEPIDELMQPINEVKDFVNNPRI